MPAVRPLEEHRFATHDGVELFYRRWPATAPRRGAIVLLHRGHEHSGRMAHLVDELDLPDFDFYAWDARGHGRSPGRRGYAPGVSHCVRDVASFVRHLGTTYDIAEPDIAIVAQSLAAVFVAAWVHDYAPRVRCLVLASPAFSVKLYVPLARPGLSLLHALRGNFFVHSYVRSSLLTHDEERQRSFDTDPLVTRDISVNLLLGLYPLAERVVADAAAMVVPTQLLVSGDDWVVRHAPQHEFFDRLGATVKEKHVLEGFRHDTLGERDRARATSLARDFLLRQFAAPAARPDLRDADRIGPTCAEAQALARPLPPFSARGLYWAVARMGMRVGGVLSDGIRLGHATGFNSGSMLDYVYRDQAAGRGALGRLADRNYLDAIGWRGIRQRRTHIEELLRAAAAQLRAAGRPVRVLDVAAGHGRYVLEVFGDAANRADAILLRDIDADNVRRAGELCAQRGLALVARCEVGDAFDRSALEGLGAHWTLAIVSGLYELFPDNAPVLDSLRGIAGAVELGGLLVYTCQPWHPQLELIARTLTSHRDGEAWVMRRRTQEEMDQLVRHAGFEKIDQRIDEWGIFTVSVARRVAEGAAPDP